MRYSMLATTLRLLYLILVFFSQQAFAEVNGFRPIVTNSQQGVMHSFELRSPVNLKIHFLSDSSFHLIAGSFDQEAKKLSDLMVVKQDAKFTGARVVVAKNGLRLHTSSLEFIADPGTDFVVLTIRYKGQNIVEGWKLSAAGATSFALRPREHFFGLGDKRLSLDHRGQAIELVNADAFDSRNNTSYKNIPFYFSSRGYGLFLKNPSLLKYDFGKSDPATVTIQIPHGNQDYYLFAGEKPTDLLAQYTEITGRPELLARWFLGFHLGRAAPGFQCAEGLKSAQLMREKKLPLEAIYFDDWHSTITNDCVKSLWDIHHTRLTLGYGMPMVGEYNGAPEGDKALLEEMETAHCLMVDQSGKAVIGPAEEVADEKNPSSPNRVGYVDFFQPKCVEKLFERKFDRAVASGALLGMADFGELGHIDSPEEKFWPGNRRNIAETHNLFSLAYGEAMVRGVQRRTGLRATGMVRPGTAGSQRLGWTTTADSTPSFDSFRAHFRAALNLSLSGYSNLGYDIGGWNGRGTSDLYARWFAAGTFNPFMWSHGIGDHEPYSYGEVTEKVTKKFLELRYQLLPFFYTEMERAHRTGVPILRPLVMQELDADQWSGVDDEVFVGDNLLLAPLFSEQGNRKVHLPAGQWYDFFSNGNSIEGGSEVDRHAVPLEQIPLYVRAGTILPLGPMLQSTADWAAQELTVHYYAHSADSGTHRSEYTLYEDSGEGLGYRDGDFTRTTLTVVQKNQKVRLRVQARRGFGGREFFDKRKYNLVVHGLSEAKRATASIASRRGTTKKQ